MVLNISKNEITRLTEGYSSKQFAEITLYLASDDYQYELRDGVIYKMPPSSMLPSKIGARILMYIGYHLLEHDLGHLTGADGAYILSDDYTYAPDVGFISYENQAEEIEQDFIPHAPDFAVEVISPTDNIQTVRDKAKIYLAHGTQLVWLVFPKSTMIEVYRQDADVEIKILDDTVTGDPVLPDFSLALKQIFPNKVDETTNTD